MLFSIRLVNALIFSEPDPGTQEVRMKIQKKKQFVRIQIPNNVGYTWDI